MERVQAIVFAALLGCSLLVARWVDNPARCESPQKAAQRAEGQAPPLNLVWGKLRGFARLAGAWLLVYQPAHGAWRVSVFVPDLGRPEPPRLEVAPWLLGAHLSLAAAQRLGHEQAPPDYFVDRLARRDWFFQDKAVLGALPVANASDLSRRQVSWSWAAPLFLGLLAVGAVSRRLRPQAPAPVFRKLVFLACGLLLFAMPSISRLTYSFFAPGVRPVVTLLVLASGVVVLLGVTAVFPVLFPVRLSEPSWYVLAVGAALGFTSGFAFSPHWTVGVAGLSSRWFLLLAAPILLSLFVDLAAAGLRILLAPLGRSAWLASVLVAVFALWRWGEWGLLLAATGLISLLHPGQRLWLAWVMFACFLPGAWWAAVGWFGPLRDSLIFMTGIVGFLSWRLLEKPEPLRGGATIFWCE